MDKKIKVIIACSGTGGHIYPGIALARELEEKGCEVLFVVPKNALIHTIFQKEGFRYRDIEITGMPRIISPKIFPFIFLLIKSFVKVLLILRQEKPDVITGTGGYISFPVIIAGKLTGKFIVILEQNSIPGLANRWLGYLADKIAVSFPDTVAYFQRNKTVFTGNPVRKELFKNNSEQAYSKFKLDPKRFTVLVFGGSQGARRINLIMIETLSLLEDIKDKIQFLHITGNNDFGTVAGGYEARGYKGCVLEYLNSMGDAYSIADLIISRSGATTIAELQILNKPSILIPFPYATNNHQVYNAQALVKSHQAVMLLEKDLRPDILEQGIKFRLKSFHIKGSGIQYPSVMPQQRISEMIMDKTKSLTV